MQRLLILMGPVASVLAGMGIAAIVEWSLDQMYVNLVDLSYAFGLAKPPVEETAVETESEKSPASTAPVKGTTASNKSTPSAKGKTSTPVAPKATSSNPWELLLSTFAPQAKALGWVYNWRPVKTLRLLLAFGLLAYGFRYGAEFARYSDQYARQVSQPSIMFKGRLNDGSEVMINDYQEAYWWLRDNTPQDSRILAWWDYGYQIAGIANRTT
jgi:dolichyl-diphosphooligosaccharide---protein glycosyltransferase